jgi:hypothetical protein
MQVRRDSIPDFSSSSSIGDITVTPGVLGGKRLNRTGGESLTVMPENGAAFIQPGTFYLAAVSEGVAPTATVMGSGNANGILASTTPAPHTDLGSISTTTTRVEPFDLAWGEMAIYRFSVPAGMKILEGTSKNHVLAVRNLRFLAVA